MGEDRIISNSLPQLHQFMKQLVGSMWEEEEEEEEEEEKEVNQQKIRREYYHLKKQCTSV